MKFAAFLFAGLILGLSILVSANTINVPEDFATIQAAINASSNGDTVLVQPGIYTENLNFNNHRIVLASMYILNEDSTLIESTIINGDSAGTVITFENGEDSHVRVIGFKITGGLQGENGGGIACINGSSPTISHNIISQNRTGYNGGGICCENNSNPDINYNMISENIAFSQVRGYGGGGISCVNSNPSIIRNTIIENSAGAGGGIFCNNSSPLIQYNNIFQNWIIGETEHNNGGGIACLYLSSPQIEFNDIMQNTADFYNLFRGQGGGIYCNQSSPIIGQNTISQNSAGMGGGMMIFNHSDPIIKNNIINHNIALSGGAIVVHLSSANIMRNIITRDSSGNSGGIYLANSQALVLNNTILGTYNGALTIEGFDSSAVINNVICNNVGSGIFTNAFFQDQSNIINNVIWGNSRGQLEFRDSTNFAIIYSDIQGGFPGFGNIDADPLFRDTTNGDFHLMSTSCGDAFNSPCIDAGDSAIVDNIIDCDYGLGTVRSDMGAYGGGLNYHAGDANGDGIANGIDVVFMVNYLKGGPHAPRQYYCPQIGYLYAAADANGNCAFNGIDVTYMVNYLKGVVEELRSCPNCPSSI
jgi:hypothetical protein